MIKFSILCRGVLPQGSENKLGVVVTSAAPLINLARYTRVHCGLNSLVFEVYTVNVKQLEKKEKWRGRTFPLGADSQRVYFSLFADFL